VSPPADPRKIALEEAIRFELFVREARRRGIQPQPGAPSIADASLAQALIQQEMKARQIRPDAISDQEAEAYYQAHREDFNKPTRVALAAVVLNDEPSAVRVLQQADGMSSEKFAELAQANSVDEKSKSQNGKFLTINDHGEDETGRRVDKPLYVLAINLRKPGAIGLVHLPNNRYYVLRAEAVEFNFQPWNKDAPHVRNIMVWERREALLTELAKQLKAGAKIEIDENALGQLAVPTQAE
jgi:peptidyl-prolyl cis-trans isomerase C